LINFRGTNQPQLFVFLVRFWAFLGKGSPKTPLKHFLQKVHVENISRKNRQKFRCHFFLNFFCFIAFSGVSRRWEFKKRFTHKKTCRIAFAKKSTKNPKPNKNCLNHVFGRFSARGVQSQKNVTSPGTFLASEEPATGFSKGTTSELGIANAHF
jgi:hypothetical protein